MEEQNQEILALAFRHAKGKNRKIEELGITPDMTKEAINEVIIKIVDAKMADEDNEKTRKDHVKGQRIYIEGLVKFAGLTNEEKLDFEYNDLFIDRADKQQLVDML